METFAERLRAAMFAAGISTPQKLAERCEFSCAEAEELLRMESPLLSVPQLLKLRLGIQVNMVWLISGKGSPAATLPTRER